MLSMTAQVPSAPAPGEPDPLSETAAVPLGGRVPPVEGRQQGTTAAPPAADPAPAIPADSSVGEDPEETVGGRLERSIGDQVKFYRTALGMTATELASVTGLSKAMISKIERAATSCSLKTLDLLATGLGIPVTELFRGLDRKHQAVHTAAGEGAVVVRSGSASGVEYRTLGALPHRTKSMRPALITFAEGADISETFQHPGSEFIHVLAGALVYAHGDRRYHLRTGDSLYFDGEAPHGVAQLLATPVRMLSVVDAPAGSGSDGHN